MPSKSYFLQSPQAAGRPLEYPGCMEGYVDRYDEARGGWYLNIGGVFTLLGGWWLEAAFRGRLDTLPVINMEPVMQ